MIVQNISNNSGMSPARLISNDAPIAVVTEPSMPAIAQPAAAVAQPPSAAQLQGAVNKLNRAMQQSNQSLEFSVDPNTKTPIVKLTDAETGKVIHQYPSEQVLAIAESIDQFLSEHQLKQGLLLQQKA